MIRKLYFLLLGYCVFNLQAIYAQNVFNNDSVKINIQPLPDAINSPFDDYAPVITADGEKIFFTSRRPFTEKEIKKNKQSFEHIYFAVWDEKGKEWSKAKPLPENINIPVRHSSNIAVSNDGQRLLIYQDDVNGNGDIHESILRGKEWTNPVALPEPVNSQYHESSAAYSPDGRTLYFVSDRPGGKGGRDIWVSKRDLKTGKWSTPKNLGAPINTTEDEEAVFIHPDGKTLFFSSKGHNSIGGYDIFYSVFEDGEWSEPVNLGIPVNTHGDDLFFVLRADGKKAYYASVNNNGDKDIYEISFETKAKAKQPSLLLLKGIVADDETKQPIQATIELVDNATNELIGVYQSNGETGEYLISLPSGKNYGLNVSAPGYLFHSENFTIADTATYQKITKNIFLQKAKKGSKVVLRNIFFDYNKATLRPESKVELERVYDFLNHNPNVKIEISGHTDDIGSQDYNQKLSEARAKSVVDYLIRLGISPDRLSFKGYGKLQPMVPNDSEENRQLNRRVEFKILEM